MVLYEIPGGHEINRGLVGYWKLDDLKAGSGITKAIDRANFNDGTITGATNTEGINGLNADAMFFDGVDDKVSVGSPSILTEDRPQMTMVIWIKPLTLTGDVDLFGQGFFNRIYLRSGGNFTLVNKYNGVEDDITSNLSDAISIGELQQIAYTYDANGGTNNLKVYVNGVLSKSETRTGNITDLSAGFVIGDSSGGVPFFGTLAICRRYHRTLTSGEISKLFRLKL